MRALTIRQQIYIFIALLIVVIGIMFAIIIFPAVSTIVNLQKDIQKTHQFLESRYENAHKTRQSLDALDDVEVAVRAYEYAALSKSDELGFITQLEKIAELHDVEQQLSVEFYDQKRITAAKEKNGIKKPHYRFSFYNKGTYQSLWAYIESLEALPQYMHIDRIVFEVSQQTGKRGGLTVRFDGVVYAK